MAMQKDMMSRAVRDSFAKLDPRVQIQNPVMFLVWLSAVMTSVLAVASIFGVQDAGVPTYYVVAIAVILWLTDLFSNFAEALAEGRGKADRADGPGVGNQKPCCAEGVAHQKPQNAGQNRHRKRGTQAGGYQPVDQRGGAEAQNITAGDTQKRSSSPLKSGKHRQTDQAQQQIYRHGIASPASAQQGQRRKNTKGLQRKGNRSWNGDPGAHGDQDSTQGNIGQVPGAQTVRNRFSRHWKVPPKRSSVGEYSTGKTICQP